MKLKLHSQIFVALLLSVLVAMALKVANVHDSSFANGLVSVCDFLGKFFMNALKMVVVPLIVSSIISGVMGLGSERNFGRMAFKTLAFYVVSGVIAVVVGLFVVNVMRPGIVSVETAQNILGQAERSEAFIEKVSSSNAQDMVEIFLRMVPPNIIEAATDNGQLLGLITFSLIFGFFIGKLPESQQELQKELWESVQGVMMMVTDLIIRLAPIGVFGLVTPIILRTGFGLFYPVMMFFLTVLISLAINFFLVMGGMLHFFGRVKVIEHYKAMAPVLLTSFSTASSASTLPVTIEAVEREAGVSNRTASFMLPLGATINMGGTALYECTVVIFIAQLYGVLNGYQIGLVDQILVVMLSWLTSIGVAGIPAASLVAITVILGVVGLPVEAVGVVWVTDRILDMCRTMVNVFSDTVGAVIIDRSEGERTAYPLD
tara:strand:- start:60864 stop:62156 length:1293 start_codon:yes stop_codon:yes gene_type:complete